jgi:hypothetical protein
MGTRFFTVEEVELEKPRTIPMVVSKYLEINKYR